MKKKLANIDPASENEWFEGVINWLSPLLNALAILKRVDESGRPSEDALGVVSARERGSLNGSKSRKHAASKVGHVVFQDRKRSTQNKRHRP
jgi:hypothetical protein